MTYKEGQKDPLAKKSVPNRRLKRKERTHSQRKWDQKTLKTKEGPTHKDRGDRFMNPKE